MKCCLPLLVFCLAPWLSAQTALPSGQSLLASPALEDFTWRTEEGWADAVDHAIVPVDGPGFAQAWRVETKRDASPAAVIELRALNARAVKAGDVAMLRFHARSLGSTDESGAGRIFLVVRRNGVDFNSSFELGVSFREEWQEFLFPFKFHKDFAAGEAAIMLRFGFMRQTVEVGGLEVIDYGTSQNLDDLPRTRFSYAGREEGAAWRAAAEARIEEIRKGDFTVRVVDAAGKPLSDAVVKIEQTRSAFEWGTALDFSALLDDSADSEIYREKTLALFNAASPENDLKWVTWVGDWGPGFSPERALAGLRWLKEHDLPTRGHVLVWPGRKNLPQFIQERLGTPREKEIPALIETHIREMAEATRGLITEWDVLNEPFTNHDLMDVFGPEIMVDWFKTAAEAMPGLPLYLNDFSNHDLTTDRDHVEHFLRTTQFLLDHGAPLSGLGLQAHIGPQPNAPVEVLRVLDRYAEFGLPIRVTEFDVWTDDERLQADYTRDFLTLMFSHPSVVGVQHWGFWAGRHWRPICAMYREDWTEKPNAVVYRELVLQRWMTRVEARSDAAGMVTDRGFYGDYRITAEHEGWEIEAMFTLRPGPTAPVVEITFP